jgi:hypothetical protein
MSAVSTNPEQPGTTPGMVDERRPRWLLGTIVGLVGGLAAGVLYGVVSSAMNAEVLYFMIIVGGIGGFLLRVVGRVSGPVAGLVSVVIGVASIAVAIILLLTTELFGSLGGALRNLDNVYYDKLFSAYFSDPLGYVWAGAGIVVGFFLGSGWSQRAAASSGGPALATQAPPAPNAQPTTITPGTYATPDSQGSTPPTIPPPPQV